MSEQELLALDELQFIERAYPFALGRPADPRGLRDYLQRLRKGTPKTQVLDELLASDEGREHAARQRGGKPAAQRKAPTPEPAASGLGELLALDDDAFIANAYRLVLGREPDQSGMQNYRVALRTGVHPVELLRQLLESEEGRTRNPALPEIRAAIARRRYTRTPGIRHALRAWNLVRRQWGSRPAPPPRRAAPAAAARSPAVDRPLAPAALKPVVWPTPSQLRNPTKTMNDAPLSTGDATEATSRLATAEEQVAALTPVESTAAASLLADDAPPWAMTIEGFVGPTLHGWSFVVGEQGAFSVEFGGRIVGKVETGNERPDVQETFGLPDPKLGFSAILGGLLQFSAMAVDCSTVRLSQNANGGGARVVNLHEQLDQGLTFSPMRALMRPLLGRQAGNVRSMRLVSMNEASLLFESDKKAPGGDDAVFLDLYQEQKPGVLARIARFEVELSGQAVDLGFRLLDAEAPLLLVITDRGRSIITTDCFPLPSLLSDANAPLIEYHVVLETGKPAFGVAAKIARTFLDAAINERLGGVDAGAGAGPRRSTTAMVLFSRGAADPHIASLLEEWRPLAAEVVYLDRTGDVHRTSGEGLSLPDFAAASPAKHMLFLEAGTRLRPDFWSLVDLHRFRLGADPELVHWHAIWIDGMSRPQVVKTGLLLDPVFQHHALLEARSLMVSREALMRAVERKPAWLRSGRLQLETAFADVAPEGIVQLPVVMDIVRAPIAPLVEERYRAEQAPLPLHPALAAQARPHAGVSVIINYRDGVADTLRCLDSIRGQAANGPLEIVLVNNASTPDSVFKVLGRARELFGSDNVKPIDYPRRFNHSEQCNIAAVASRHDLLLMLSNDSCFRTPDAIARAAEIAMVPWVGSCGFRIIGNEAAKGRLQSLGLALNERRYLFSGASPLTTGLPPSFALDCTFEVVGNTFAAVMLRRDVYAALDGLDTVAFPTSYNDIDFSFRAIHAGYRHVVIGSEIVEHMGRGSREADQDLPIDQRIVERSPRLDVLARIGFQQL